MYIVAVEPLFVWGILILLCLLLGIALFLELSPSEEPIARPIVEWGITGGYVGAGISLFVLVGWSIICDDKLSILLDATLCIVVLGHAVQRLITRWLDHFLPLDDKPQEAP